MEDINTATISKRSAHGILALISRTFFLNLISFGASIIIYTKLAASDIGIYTAVLAIQRIISFFTDFGFGAALVQKKDDLTQEDITTTFTIQAFVTSFIFLLVFLLRSPIADFFKIGSEGMWLLFALVFTVFLSSFKTIPSILLERKIHFQKLIIPQIAESITFNILLIMLVIKGLGINSYSWAFLVSSLVGIPFYYYVSPWRLRIGIDRNSLRHLRYGATFQVKNILATLKDDLLTVFLTKLLTFTEIGYIGFAQRFAFFVYRYIVDSVTKVTFSTYSRIQHDMEYMKKAIEKSLFFVSAIMFPVIFGLIISAPYVIAYFPKWHNKWEPAIISLTFFSLNALVSSLSGILVNVLDATGRVKTTLRLMVFWTVLVWVLTPVLIHFYGYNGVAIASFIVTLTIFITIYLVKKVVDFEFIKSIYKPFTSSLIMGLFVYLGAKIFVSNFLTLILVILIGGGIYSLIFYLWAGEQISKDFKKLFMKDRGVTPAVSS